MAESASPLRKGKTKEVLTDSDMVAAQKLMQLSGDEDNDNNTNIHKKKKKNTDEEMDQTPSEISTSAIIQEIFGKEEEVLRPRKRRYRSLAHIYMTTKPITVRPGNWQDPITIRHGKKRRY